MSKGKKIKVFILGVAFTILIFQFKTLAQSSVGTPRVNIDTNKEWTVKFSRALNPSTVNSSNISVTHVIDGKNVTVPVMVTLGSDPTTAIVSPRTGGYEPGEKYNLTISGSIESASGKKLNNSVTLQFVTDNAYSDGTNYPDLPSISSNQFEYTPLLSSQKQGFFLNGNNGTSVQYRVFVNAQNEAGESYTELTSGYTSEENGKITSLKTLSSGSNGEKYKAIIYVKRTGASGAHRDANTDYDNYYIDYFRCVDSIDVNSGDYVDYNLSLDDIVNTQVNLDSNSTPVFVADTAMDNAASKNQIKYYVNPDNFLDSYGKYQFLKLTYEDGITVDSLNNFLKGKGIFEGMGQSFLDAAENNNISVAYLVSHAMLETGNGESQLANGGARDSKNKYVYGKAVYNFFGIGATGEDAVLNGTKTAYENGWDTPEKALSGGAKWIAAQYINNPSYNQDTLYKMRWDPANPGQHQYATDIAWAYKQISNIKSLQDILSGSNVNLKFEIPRLKK
ncbi:glucosaminidase domain-containing protein [Clostridium sp. HV4-5-A1G]|uniref:glucosaminidase domain-containing protein n=1 Tax=Clostridium sp. HV4-5-A1G TaxID=2004595 RepID=UPI00123A53B3|nr:glucosaminidase domain-containing protein [Clostridium sp. HV4-5-A1G]KAA8671989.1 hydrolase [Clostridium sp. HV4-5-A1G]